MDGGGLWSEHVLYVRREAKPTDGMMQGLAKKNVLKERYRQSSSLTKNPDSHTDVLCLFMICLAALNKEDKNLRQI